MNYERKHYAKKRKPDNGEDHYRGAGYRAKKSVKLGGYGARSYENRYLHNGESDGKKVDVGGIEKVGEEMKATVLEEMKRKMKAKDKTEEEDRKKEGKKAWEEKGPYSDSDYECEDEEDEDYYPSGGGRTWTVTKTLAEGSYMHQDYTDKQIENFYDYMVVNCEDLNEAIRAAKGRGAQGVRIKCPVRKFVGAGGKNVSDCDQCNKKNFKALEDLQQHIEKKIENENAWLHEVAKMYISENLK